MTTESPMTPADCDLRGLEWMPLYGGRLFGSDFDAHATDAEWRAAMQLWWAAWNQVPAASLPDDDVALCRLAGFGRDVKAWRKVKERALYGFALCTDGRLYHKALAVFALDSWQRRLKDRERKAKYRAQKDQPKGADGTRTETGTGRGNDVGQPRHGTADEKRQDRTGQDETGQDATFKEEAAAARATEDAAFEAYRKAADLRRWPSADILTSTRRYQLGSRLRECGGLDGWNVALEKAEGAEFLKGKGFFDFDWMVKPENFARLLEGRFDQKRTPLPSGKTEPVSKIGVMNDVIEYFNRKEAENVA